MSTATTYDSRTWTPRGYTTVGAHPDGTTRTLTPGTADGDTPETRRAAAIELTHLANGVIGTDRAVFDAIRALSNGHGDYVRVQDIRERTGYAAATILASADRLEAVGYLRRPGTAGGRKYIQLAEGWR